MADKSKDQMAVELADLHYHGGMEVDEIYRLESDIEDEETTVKLLEITQDTIPAGLAPVFVGTHPASGTLYPSVIVAVTTEKFTDALREQLKRENGWRVARKYEKPRKSRRIPRR